VILLDSTLNEHPIELLGFRGSEVVFRDDAGRTQTTSLESVAALLPRWWSPTWPSREGATGYTPSPASGKPLPISEGSGFIELVDGQRTGGGLSMSTEAGGATSVDDVRWETGAAGFGRVAVKLDSVRRIRFTPMQASTGKGTLQSPSGVTNTLPPPSPAASSRVTGQAEPQPAAKSDQVWLVNGDRLSGFVERIGPVVTIDANGRGVDTPIKQVAEIRLLNAPRAPKGTRIWMSGGNVIDAARLSADTAKGTVPRADAVRVELSPEVWKRAGDAPPKETPRKESEADGGKPPASPGKNEDEKVRTDAPSALLSMNRILAIVPHVESLVSLASLQVTRQWTADERPRFEPMRLSWFGSPMGEQGEVASAPASVQPVVAVAPSSPTSVQPPMGAADIELPGPMLVEWSLPASAARIAGWAELPRECWTWGDCTVVVSLASAGDQSSAGSKELFRETLSSERATAEFNLLIDATTLNARERVLRVEVLPGDRGPIQDRVLLRRVLLLCQSSVRK